MTNLMTNYINQTVMATTERVAEKVCCTSMALLAAEAVVMANRKCTNQTVQTATAHVTHAHTSSRSRVMMLRLTVIDPHTISTTLKAVLAPSATSAV